MATTVPVQRSDRAGRARPVVGRTASAPVVARLAAPAATTTLETDVLVVGTGIAGLAVAHDLAGSGLRVDLVTKASVGEGSTPWAQGGIATGGAPDDAPALHVADTLAAGAGLADEAAVTTLVAEAPVAVGALLAAGARFDTDADGALAWTREGGHSRSRIIHAGGDATGLEVQRTLQSAVLGTGAARVHERTFLLDLLTADDGTVVGALLARLGPDGGCREVVRVAARAVVLASGGHGQVFDSTTNPAVATGDGLAAAVRAGAAVADAEFVQFHPTALAARRPGQTGAQRPLVSEAVRGEGAVLLDAGGTRFMAGRHPLADLAPRDVVAAAIGERIAATGAGHVLLDARHLGAALLERRFPTVLASCRAAGVDPVTEPVPVLPAAHYACGGVVADLSGRTSIAGLFAVGEVARTGVHGANRLASNSLLEALVVGRRLAALLRADLPPRRRADAPGAGAGRTPSGGLVASGARAALTAGMSRDAGVLRDPVALASRAALLADLVRPTPTEVGVPGLADWETTNLHAVASVLVAAALLREESRGCHRRTDVTAPDDAWLHPVVAHAPGTPGTVRLEVRP
ncbi:L-aspartate oxidase [Kineosporia sp. R_H_3]|uniref:L-aspartate oxidase n=1 Tax=Kineosporia sp. R_H_3 TaxID=1961848 RepID=UPI0018E98A56|nr:L-aspartate oxidase [Kineosporia sp. R_H_3]